VPCVQAVPRRLWFYPNSLLVEFYGGHNGNGTGSSPRTYNFSVIVIPFKIHMHINSSPTLYNLSRRQFHFATKHPPLLSLSLSLSLPV
jgi:hypothetical protein